ncbi:hypothetical protein ZHAS_00015205 [Anopheles sinensis]|uniref:Uncharacterized protein n=1 Tax=Anopheles sinensis TaxID=74873 RepID=A0A084WAD9_ANOSI|nr:hypothetical protein ZHAS_00015205 [Anopheles sinensis]
MQHAEKCCTAASATRPVVFPAGVRGLQQQGAESPSSSRSSSSSPSSSSSAPPSSGRRLVRTVC